MEAEAVPSTEALGRVIREDVRALEPVRILPQPLPS